MSARDAGKPRAVALLSGGLDSALAIRLLLDQGVPVTALHFVSVFSPGKGPEGKLLAREVADELGVPLIVREATRAMLEFVPSPRFGWGRNMNPCLDCRAYQLGIAKSLLEETGAAYVATGEVLGQRPMSQRRDAMKRIDEAAGLEGMVLRPLTAINLEGTTPEERGWVDRTQLLGITGRSRSDQKELAKRWGLKSYGTPAGGCLLTDQGFAWKLQDLLNYEGELTANEVHLLKLGRHFRLGPRSRTIVGRNERENAKMLSYALPGDRILVAAEGSSPETLVRGEAGREELETAAALTARYSRHRNKPEVEVIARKLPAETAAAADGEELRLSVPPAGQELIDKLAIRRPAPKKPEPASQNAETDGSASASDDGGLAQALAPGAAAGALAAAEASPSGAGPPRRPMPKRRRGEVEKTFMGHLMELRTRIFVCLIFLLLAMGAAWVFYAPLTEIVRRPLDEYNAAQPEEAHVRVITLRPTEPFVFVLRLGLWAGFILAFPVIAWQVWRFVSPGLYGREKLAILPIFTVGILFFAGGSYFAYRLVFPYALAYLYSFAPILAIDSTVGLDYYYRFFLMIHLAFGIAFETPLVILALASLGLVTPRGLARRWQYVAVGCFVAGAFLTPPDPVTQILMGRSLFVLYLLSILLALIFGRRKSWYEEEREKGEASPRPNQK